MQIPVVSLLVGLAVASLVASSLAPSASAQAAPNADLRARPSLIPEKPHATPGETLWIAVDFEIDDGWHTYWPGVNDTGMAFEPVLELSPGVEAGKPVWPAPHRYVSPGDVLDHTFEERMTVLLPLEISPDVEPGRDLTIKMRGQWLVCETLCIIESADLSLTIPAREAGSVGSAAKETAALFAQARSRVPQRITDTSPVRAKLKDGTLTLESPGATRLAFYPHEDSREPRDLLARGEAEGERLTLDFREGDEPVLGVVEVWSAPGRSRVFSVELPSREAGPS